MENPVGPRWPGRPVGHATRLTVGLMLFLLTGAGFGCRRVDEPAPQGAESVPERVVALAPNLSEAMYALGLGERVVGVTAFARYPEDVQSKPKVGGYAEVNTEAVFALQPDAVLALDQQADVIARLQRLGLTVYTFEQDSIADIQSMLRRLGAIFDQTERAAEWLHEIEQEQERLRNSVPEGAPIRVLISVGRNMGSEGIGELYVAGNRTIFGEIIALAGAQNAYTGDAPYAVLGREALLRLHPDVILDLMPDANLQSGFDPESVRRDWQSLARIPAVRDGRVHILTEDYVCLPGPRIARTLRTLAATLRGEGTPTP